MPVFNKKNQLKPIQKALFERKLLVDQNINILVILFFLYFPFGWRNKIGLAMSRFELIPDAMFAVGLSHDCNSCCRLVFVAVEREYVLGKDSDILLNFLHYSMLLIILYQNVDIESLSFISYYNFINNELFWNFSLPKTLRICCCISWQGTYS